MNAIQRAIRRADAFQQEHSPLAFLYGVVKKYGNDNGGALTVQLTYSLFTTVFPLLLLLVTILALVLANDPSARRHVLQSAFSQFPIVGTDLSRNIHVMKRNSAFGLAIGIVGLAYGTTGLAGTGLYTMEQVWNIPGTERPGFVPRMLRSLLFLATLGIGLVITTVISSYGTFGGHRLWTEALAELVAAIGNVGLYVAAFRVLTPPVIRTRQLVAGSVFAGIVWTVLQAAGGFVVNHYLKGDNAVYGTFGTVLGLIAWIALGAQVTVYAAELNSVLARRLWPRALLNPPLTAADQRTLANQVLQNRRRPEQEVVTRVWGKPMTAREFLANGGEVDASVLGYERRLPADSPDGAEALRRPAEPAPS
jgi:YihY family inner membrane protein